MGAVVDAARVQGGHAGLDVVAAEEVAVVVEDELVVVGVAVIEGHAEGVIVLFEGPGDEAANDGSAGDERGVRAGRQVRAMAVHGPDIAHVDLPHGEIALPSHDVHGVERVDDGGDFVLDFDADLPLAMVVKLRVGFGRHDHAGIVEGMLAQQTFLGLIEFGLRLNDEEEIIAAVGQDAVGDGARDVDIVALFEVQRAEVGFDAAVAAMDEEQFIAVGVAIVERHGFAAAGDEQRDIGVAQEGGGHACGVVEVGGLKQVEIEAVGAEFSLEADPAGGSVGVIEVRRLAEESFAAVLLFEGAFGKTHVGLASGLAFFEWIHARGISCIQNSPLTSAGRGSRRRRSGGGRRFAGRNWVRLVRRVWGPLKTGRRARRRRIAGLPVRWMAPIGGLVRVRGWL